MIECNFKKLVNRYKSDDYFCQLKSDIKGVTSDDSFKCSGEENCILYQVYDLLVPKFKVGDRIRFINFTLCTDDIGTISEIDGDELIVISDICKIGMRVLSKWVIKI